MRLAEIDANGLILNVIEADQRPDWALDWPEIGTAAGPGWSLIAGEFVAPAEPDPAAARAAMSLTRRQVIIGMAMEGLISHAEGVALAATGVAPAAVETMLSAMPEPDQTAARITLASFTTAYRLDPMVQLFQAAGGLTDAQMDAFFAAYAAV